MWIQPNLFSNYFYIWGHSCCFPLFHYKQPAVNILEEVALNSICFFLRLGSEVPSTKDDGGGSKGGVKGPDTKEDGSRGPPRLLPTLTWATSSRKSCR